MRSSLLREIGEGRARRPGSNGLAKPGNWRRKRRDSRSCRPWAAGVRDGHGVPQAGEPARQRAADFAGANDADFHVLVIYRPKLINIFVPIRAVRYVADVNDE